MPTIGEALAALESQLFVGRDHELERFARWLAADQAPVEILHVIGPGGVGKSALLGAFARIAETQGRTPVHLDARDFRPTPQGFLRALGATDVAQAHAQLNARPSLLLVDTFEELGELIPFLSGEFLPGLDLSARVVLAGRQALRRIWAQQPGWPQLVRPMLLTGFSPSESLAYLDRRGVTVTRLREQLPAVTSGHPLALSLAADLVLHLGVRDLVAAPEWHLILRSLLETMLRDLPDPVLRELLEASAVVRQFDETLLQALTEQTNIGAAFDRLCQLSMVRAAEHGLMLHDDVRRILADDLRWRRPERYRELRLRALAHYRRLTLVATAQEREWLLAERLFLWEHAWVQTMLFGQDDPGELWVEPGEQADEAAALAAEMTWHTEVLPGFGIVDYAQDPNHSLEGHAADMAHLLGLPGRRLRIARDPEGQVLGFSLVVRVCAANVEHLASHPFLGPLIRAYFELVGWDSVPGSPETSHVSYFVQLANIGIKPDAVNGALWRELFGVFAEQGVVLISVALEAQKQLLRALGFEWLATPQLKMWGMRDTADAYMLDLRAIGLEPWIEAITAGRRPPLALSAVALELAVQAALSQWHDDAALAASALASSAAVARAAPGQVGADAVRQAISESLERARGLANPDLALAYRAVEGAYLQKTGSHEQVAADLDVSRSTFYRLLKRGVEGLARTLAARSGGPDRAPLVRST